ncbi:hypothetical protein DIDNDMLP_00163 [Klebsiella phage KP13-7]|nr:hypothetical protein CPT_Muenster_504 [Klebsiella phage Muenster]UYL05148.1 hypothetical protein DIDNDMLP_00163 [Klebsiella phage KP13-7]
MILSKEEQEIVAQAMSLLHLTTDKEKDLFNRLKTGVDTVQRIKESNERKMKFHASLIAMYGPNAHLHYNDYYEYCEKNGFW